MAKKVEVSPEVVALLTAKNTPATSGAAMLKKSVKEAVANASATCTLQATMLMAFVALLLDLYKIERAADGTFNASNVNAGFDGVDVSGDAWKGHVASIKTAWMAQYTAGLRAKFSVADDVENNQVPEWGSKSTTSAWCASILKNAPLATIVQLVELAHGENTTMSFSKAFKAAYDATPKAAKGTKKVDAPVPATTDGNGTGDSVPDASSIAMDVAKLDGDALWGGMDAITVPFRSADMGRFLRAVIAQAATEDVPATLAILADEIARLTAMQSAHTAAKLDAAPVVGVVPIIGAVDGETVTSTDGDGVLGTVKDVDADAVKNAERATRTDARRADAVVLEAAIETAKQRKARERAERKVITA